MRVSEQSVEMSHNIATLKQRQSLPLEAKVRMSIARIKAWYEHWDGDVYVAFSGGKDSTVLLDLVRSVYPDVEAAFGATGLEYPEIMEFVRTIDNVAWLKPKKNFRRVILEEGYPVVSKKQAKMLRRLQNPCDANAKSNELAMTGITSSGRNAPAFKLAEKWKPLIDADFKISEKCCDYLKTGPMRQFEKETGLYPFVGTMADESTMRQRSYLEHGCNLYDSKRPRSAPLSFWTEDDIWEYIRTRSIPYASIYDKGETRTGCMFCMFGVHMEKGENRFQRMAKSHPKQYDYCINKLGMGAVLTAIGVEYEPETDPQLQLFEQQ